MRILLVEDDLPLAKELKASLHHKGYAVDHVDNGKHALLSVDANTADLIILDLGLPDLDGLDVLKILKQGKTKVSVLILTARDGVEHKVKGLDLGADDYLAKPFSIEELFARIRVIERKRGTNVSSVIQVKEAALDVTTNVFTVNSQSINLSRREFMILRILMENIDRVQSKDSLETKLYEWGDEISSNTIEVHVSNLRKKLPSDFIKTIRGVGYVVRAK
ncbi:MAG: two-component system OmpR family response regulator [Alphaproteobacteria bacterium]|jgi:two-component system OmpR family response regulator